MRRVLVVEDDQMSQMMLMSLLVTLGYEVTTCSDGLKACNLHREDPFHIIVSDWRLPRMDGIELCRVVRGHEVRGPYTYFMLLTGSCNKPLYETQAMDAGVDDFLSKPLRLQELRNRLTVAQRYLEYTSSQEVKPRLLPMCSYCKSVRDETNKWQHIEKYILTTTGRDCTHSICPECYERLVLPQLRALHPGELPPGIESPHSHLGN